MWCWVLQSWRGRWARAIWLGLMLVATILPAVAGAVESRPLNLVTSPLPINLQTAPGKTVTTELKIKQNSGDTERLKISLMKFGAFGDEGKPRLLDRERGDDYFDWVKFDKPSFVAPNNVWQTVKMTINVPKTAAFGYYYAVVFSRQGDDALPGSNTNALNGGSAVLVLLDAQVPGAKRQVQLDGLTSRHGIYEFLPAEFSVSMRNTGNVHVVPHGNIFISKGKKPVATLTLNEEQGNILPNSRRSYPVDWTDGWPHFEKIVEDGKVKMDGNGRPMRHLVWGNAGEGAKDIRPHLRMGRYTAHVFAVYDDGQRDVPLEAEVSFWVIPWRFLAGALVVVLLVGAGTYSLTRSAWQKGSRMMRRRRR